MLANYKKNERNDISFNYNEDVVVACVQANLIADFLRATVVTPIHMFWAIALNKQCPIHRYMAENGYSFDAVSLMDAFFSNSVAYEMITNEEYPFKLANGENGGTDEDKNNETEDNDVKTQDVEICDASDESSNAAENDLEDENQKIEKSQDENSPINIIINIADYNKNQPKMGLIPEDFEVEYSDEMLDVFQKTARCCLKAKQSAIDLNNLLYQLISSEEETLITLFVDYLNFSYEELLEFMDKNCKIFVDSGSDTISIPKALKECCTILNDKYTPNDVCDILGRDEEVDLLWNIFSKKTKRNAILVGEPGVGKSAIMEALTMQIVNGTCPEKFLNHYVVELNLIGMVAGTTYRGEFEQKMEHLISFLEKTDNVILFVDEIHQLLGAGSTSEGGVDMSGALKPILARDDVVFVGATTTREYNQILSRDGAFKRRFELVTVKEPRHYAVKPMIRKRVESLVKYHNVKVSEKLLDRVITLAYAFNTTTSNPDKTIDLLDRSMAKASICKSKKLKEEHVQAIFAKNFKHYANLSEERCTSTAYHEAGHYIALRVLEDILQYKIVLVSIVPNADYAGITYYEYPEYSSAETTREYLYARIKVDLAGRVAQFVFNNKFTAGASNDLEKANQLIEEMLTEYGMFEEYENLVLPYDLSGIHKMSDDMLNELRVKKMEILKKVYSETEELINDNIAALERVVKLLLEKQIATAEELDAAYRGE